MLEADYKTKLEEAVFTCKSNLRDFAFTSGMRSCRVIAAWAAMKKRPNLWGPDPVHPVESGYDDIAKVIIACLPAKDAKRSRAEGDNGGGSTSAPKRRRDDQQWPVNPRQSYGYSPYHDNSHRRGSGNGSRWCAGQRGGGPPRRGRGSASRRY